MREAEAREQPYLSKLRLTQRVKGLVQKLFRSADWADAGQGWEGLDDTLTLSGWSRARRVVVLRRKLTGELLLTGKDALQDQFAFLDFDVPTARYEYAVLVTSTTHEIVALAQLYRDRADAENNFDELKNQWGWLHHPRFGALPFNGADGGCGLQLVELIRASGPAAQTF